MTERSLYGTVIRTNGKFRMWYNGKFRGRSGRCSASSSPVLHLLRRERDGIHLDQAGARPRGICGLAEE